MLSPELFRETLDTANVECWERERTATLTRRNASRSHTIDHRFLGTPVRAFAVRLHATSCSFREIQEILRLFGVQRSHQVIFQWVHRVADSVPDPPEAKPKRVAVDETAVKINGEWSRLYAAIDLDTKLILGVDLFGRHGTDSAAAFLHGLSEKHDLSEAVFLVDGFVYQTALAQLGLSGRRDYTDRNLIEKWFQTLKMGIDRFHNSWVGSRSSVRRWCAQFAHYYNRQRPHQSLDDRTPAEEVAN